MREKLFDSEWKVMEVLWARGPLPAKEVSRIVGETVGWNKNTTYTVLTKLVDKGFARREDPGFVCTALITRDEARRHEADSLVRRMFNGSRAALFSALLDGEPISREEADSLRALIEKSEKR